jgi:anaerobic selenocysteine-containing dehydrogenase
VRGSKDNPLTQGVICEKVTKYYPDFVHGERRLTQPLQRTGPRGTGNYKSISWKHAIELCYQGIQKTIDKYGTESVLPYNYAGPHGQLAGGSMDRRFFYKLGATQVNRSPLCAGVRALAYSSMFGDCVAMPMEQAEFSDLIIIWGNNTSSTTLHLMKIINTARKKGAKVIVIDPQRIKVSKIADLYLQITPGSDAFFALAMAAEFDQHGMVERDKIQHKVNGLEDYLQQAKNNKAEKIKETCGVSQSQIKEFIKLFQQAKKVSMMTGVGLERSLNGGSATRAAMALAILTGNFGSPGQGVMGFYGTAFNKTPDKLQRPDLLEKQTRTLSILDIPDHLLNPENTTPIKTVFIYNHNPIVMNPDQNKIQEALSQQDLFIIGCDITMTDSMKYADIILPAASHFEHKDVFAAYGHTYLQRADAVIDPVGEALPNTEIFRRLSLRFGFTEKAFTDSDDDLMEQAFNLESNHSIPESIADINPGNAVPVRPVDQIWLSDVDFSSDYKINFYSEKLESEYGLGLPRFQQTKQKAPFRLLTPASSKRSNGTFGGHSDSCSVPEVDINTEDALKLGIKTGQNIKLKNNKGEVVLKALVGNVVAPGVLCSLKGAWRESSPTGQTVNALIDSCSKTDIGEGAAFYDTFVDIEIV